MPSKLTSPFLGPCKVFLRVKNNVEAHCLLMKAISLFNVSSLKLFMGKSAEAQEMAQREADQHMFLNIRA